MRNASGSVGEITMKIHSQIKALLVLLALCPLIALIVVILYLQDKNHVLEQGETQSDMPLSKPTTWMMNVLTRSEATTSYLVELDKTNHF